MFFSSSDVLVETIQKGDISSITSDQLKALEKLLSDSAMVSVCNAHVRT